MSIEGEQAVELTVKAICENEGKSATSTWQQKKHTPLQNFSTATMIFAEGKYVSFYRGTCQQLNLMNVIETVITFH